MRSPQLTVRARLTALYALLVTLSTGTLLVVSYWLLARHFDRTLPNPLAESTLDDVGLQYLIAFVGIVLISTVVGWVIAGRALEPLQRNTATAQRVSEQRLDERIPVEGPQDELHELALTLNSMLDRLAESFDAQRRFVANASHELRGPLTVIRSEAEVSLANPEPDIDELRRMARTVIGASRRTEALLASLLILARGQRGLVRTEAVDLADTATEVLAAAQPAAAAESVRLTSALEPSPVEGDSALLERLVANLVENGTLYNRPGGFIEISTRAGMDTVELRVENSGPPISPEDAARLAEPFERLAREAGGRGAGLGLSIVRAVAEAHGGELTIEPRAEGGLVVSVRLPRGAEAGGAAWGGSRGARPRSEPAAARSRSQAGRRSG
jgi:signal transduction histidine kinase